MEAKTVFFNYYDLEGIRREINDDLEKFYNVYFCKNSRKLRI